MTNTPFVQFSKTNETNYLIEMIFKDDNLKLFAELALKRTDVLKRVDPNGRTIWHYAHNFNANKILHFLSKLDKNTVSDKTPDIFEKYPADYAKNENSILKKRFNPRMEALEKEEEEFVFASYNEAVANNAKALPWEPKKNQQTPALSDNAMIRGLWLLINSELDKMNQEDFKNQMPKGTPPPAFPSVQSQNQGAAHNPVPSAVEIPTGDNLPYAPAPVNRVKS